MEHRNPSFGWPVWACSIDLDRTVAPRRIRLGLHLGCCLCGIFMGRRVDRIQLLRGELRNYNPGLMVHRGLSSPMLVWLWITVFLVLMGARGKRTGSNCAHRPDSHHRGLIGRGERGAYVADNLVGFRANNCTSNGRLVGLLRSVFGHLCEACPDR